MRFDYLSLCRKSIKNRKIKRSKAVAFSAILTALAVVIMFLGALFEVFELVSAMVASFCVIFAIMELGFLLGVGVFLASTILAMLLGAFLPVVAFASFFGIYPIVKSLFEFQKSRIIEWLLKSVYLVLITVGSITVFFWWFITPELSERLKPFAVIIGIFLFAFFCFYDFVLSYSITVYNRTLRKRFGIDRIMR